MSKKKLTLSQAVRRPEIQESRRNYLPEPVIAARTSTTLLMTRKPMFKPVLRHIVLVSYRTKFSAICSAALLGRGLPRTQVDGPGSLIY